MSLTVSLSSAQAAVLGTALAALLSVLVTVAFARLYGLRSLAKFAPHDFVVTVALGSVIATTAARSVPLPTGLLALAGLFAVQWVLSSVRRRGGTTVVDNDPLLLMAGDRVLWDNMASARVTVDDLRSKLREANVLHLSEVRAVVLEGTGDISVLHADRDDATLDPGLLADVRGIDAAPTPTRWQRGDPDAAAVLSRDE